jgi:hypothetical protein
MATSLYPADNQVRMCAQCGIALERKIRSNGKPEQLRDYLKRRFCAPACWYAYCSKGDAATPDSKRGRARQKYVLPDICDQCKDAPAVERHHIDGNPGNNIPQNLSFLCRRCHQELDGRLAAFIEAGRQANQLRVVPPKPCAQCGRPFKRLARGLCKSCYDKQRPRRCRKKNKDP